MRYFVQCKACTRAVAIRTSATTRAELPYFALRCPYTNCQGHTKDIGYAPADVYADHSPSETIGGAIVVGALGALIAGPLGLAIGALVGGGAGHGVASEARDAAERFNRS